MVLLDASALIAMLYEEQGADAVARHLDDAAMLTLNLEETVGKLLRDGLDVTTARTAIDALGLDAVDFTAVMAWRSAELGRRLAAGLGLADRACLGAASVLGVAVVTADTAWRDASRRCGVPVTVIR